MDKLLVVSFSIANKWWVSFDKMKNRSFQSFWIHVNMYNRDQILSGWQIKTNFLKRSLVELFTSSCGYISNIIVIIAPGENFQNNFFAQYSFYFILLFHFISIDFSNSFWQSSSKFIDHNNNSKKIHWQFNFTLINNKTTRNKVVVLHENLFSHFDPWYFHPVQNSAVW